MWAATIAMLMAALETEPVKAQATAQSGSGTQSSVKMIDNLGGGRIYLGSLAGQPTEPRLGRIMLPRDARRA